MSRPSKNIDQILLKAGQKLAEKKGFSSLKVREVARVANVNLGMFHYYFKTKDEFVGKILQEMYEEFFKEFQIQSLGSDRPMERLRRALNTLGLFARDHRNLILAIGIDSLQGYEPTISFARRNIPRHAAIIIKLVKEYQKKGEIKKISILQILPLLLGTIAVPNVVVEVVKRTQAKKPLGVMFNIFQSFLLSDKAIRERVDLALEALSIK